MALPTVEQAEQLTCAELLRLVVELLGLAQQQQRRIAELEAALEKLRHPPVTSSNSSQPPSRDQKANKPSPQKRQKHGPPFGHPKHSRVLVDCPDVVIPVLVAECAQCHADLRGHKPEAVKRRQLTELLRVNPVVIETQQECIVCPYCHAVNHGQLPAGLEAERYFGPQLEATVIYYKHEQHLSYERIVETLYELQGVTVSEGAIAAILARAGDQAAPAAEGIKQRVITSPVIKSDETSARVEGRNWWQWVFIGATAVYHTIVPSRSAAEIATVMGEHCAEVWVSDCFSSQLTAPTTVHQLCLAHQLRELQRVMEAHPQEEWAPAVQALLREAIHLKNRFVDAQSTMTLTGYRRRVSEIENKLDRLLAQPVVSQAARKLHARFSTHRNKLLPFLYYPEVPPTNNESERALRNSVVHRKVTHGFRSQWGAKVYAALQTIISTAKQNGDSVFQTLTNLMGTPVLHFLEGSSP
jgi:transposase